MIGLIRGTIFSKHPPEVVILAHGVGYEVQMPMTSFYALPKEGEEVTIYTHLVVREDAQLLFGFMHLQERTIFRELIKANGVGPKLALTILSGMTAQQLLTAVSYEDVTALVKLPGVGKKTAERLVVELKDRLAKISLVPADTPNTLTIAPVEMPAENPIDGRDEAISALVALGYKDAQARTMVKQVYTENMASEDIIRQALRASL